MSFVHLRVHSEYSFLRGACRLEELAERAAELGMPAVALTDYGVLHGAVRFSEIMRRHGVKPILGAEFRLPSGLPLVLLVRDREGWAGLLALVNDAQLAGRPGQVEFTALEEHAAGLTAVLHTRGDNTSLDGTACLQAAAAALANLLPVFGADLYLGLEAAGLPGEARFNRQLAAEALKLGVPLVAANNVHYVRPEDDLVYRMVNSIRAGRPLAGAHRYFLPGEDYSLKDPGYMHSTFSAFPGACANTLAVAERCSFELKSGGLHLPVLSLPGGESPERALRRLCLEALKAGKATSEAAARLERELSVICGKGLASYFLIVHDLVRHARQSGIPVGPGRGSAGGSLAAFLLGITRVDPLAHGLYFERFLSEDRPGFPDIDLDVCQRRRDELVTYLKEAYGADRVAQVSTFSTLGARAAARESGKILDVTAEKVAAVAEALPHYSGPGGIAAAMERFPEFTSPALRGEGAAAVLAAAKKIEGLCRHLSTHASGVIIGREKLAAVMPLCRGPAGEILTQWDKDDVEEQGFLKIDILGSRNLTVLHDTLVYVRERHGLNLNLDSIPLDDGETFALLRRGETLGCFQLESFGMRRVLRRLAPEHIYDLVHLLSLYRPGPWESGMVEAFIARRHRREETSCPHFVLAPILADTYGVVLYQEQVMRAACQIGGYTPGEADDLRREMSRRSPALKEYHRPKFLAGAEVRGLSREEAEEVFNYLCRFAGYSFNKAHSAAYALVSYWTAFMKLHYPVEFYAALLSAGGGYYGPAVYVEEARARGIPVLSPDVNRSCYRFMPEGSAIRAGLHLVRDLGTRGVMAILNARQAGPFHSLPDFCNRVGRSALRRTALVNLAKVGAFGCFNLNQRQVLATLDDVLKWSSRVPGQISLAEFLPGELLPPAPGLAPYTLVEAVSAEMANLGMSLSAHPLSCLVAAGQRKFTPLSLLPTLPPGQAVTVAGMVVSRSRRRLKRGGVMLTLLLSDESGLAEALFYPAVYRRCHHRVHDGMVAVSGRVSADGDSVIVEEVLPLVAAGNSLLEQAGI